MLKALNNFIVTVSTNGWLFALITVLTFATLSGLLSIGAAFPVVAGGAQPFDLQNSLTATQVLEQLPGYTEHAQLLYRQFAAIDFVFPFAAGLFLAALIAFCLRYAFPAAYAWVVARHLLPLLMLGTLFDWCENVAAIIAINTYPDTTLGMANAIVIAKKLKLAMVLTSQGLAVLLLLAAGATWAVRRSRAHP